MPDSRPVSRFVASRCNCGGYFSGIHKDGCASFVAADPSVSQSEPSAFEVPMLSTGEAYRAIRRAIADPESECPRKLSPDVEWMADWQTRAVMAALGKLERRS